MSVVEPKLAMQHLCESAVEIVKERGIDSSSYRGLSVLNDPRRSEPFVSLPAFADAAAGLHGIPNVDSRIGAESVDNLTLQFVFNFLSRISAAAFDQGAFDALWIDLITEIAEPEWTYFAVCNLKNFSSPHALLVFGDGIIVRSRDYAALGSLLGWTEAYIEATLGRDWSEGGFGTHVMIVESRLAKAPGNLVLMNDLETIVKLERALLAMRLVNPGFVCPGRVFFARKAIFRFGVGGITFSGYSRWEPGTRYDLNGTDLPAVRDLYDALRVVTSMDSKFRPLNLALRAFSSIYGRDRSDDRLVDSITAIEAALRLDTDLSFRSSFQVAGLLAPDDEDRVAIFRDMKAFYDTRSKLVHGGEMKPKHTAALENYERLVDLVRRLLRGFVSATAAGAVPEAFYGEIDTALQHSERRSTLRSSFGW